MLDTMLDNAADIAAQQFLIRFRNAVASGLRAPSGAAPNVTAAQLAARKPINVSPAAPARALSNAEMTDRARRALRKATRNPATTARAKAGIAEVDPARLLTILTEAGTVGCGSLELQRLAGSDRIGVTVALRTLWASGVIRKEGQKRSTRYILAAPDAAVAG
jgi:hypothetical protein